MVCKATEILKQFATALKFNRDISGFKLDALSPGLVVVTVELPVTTEDVDRIAAVLKHYQLIEVPSSDAEAVQA